MCNSKDEWCIENDLAAQKELAYIQAAKQQSAEVTHIHDLTSALKACLKLLHEHSPEIYGIGEHAIVQHSMELIKRSNSF